MHFPGASGVMVCALFIIVFPILSSLPPNSAGGVGVRAQGALEEAQELFAGSRGCSAIVLSRFVFETLLLQAMGLSKH